MKIENVKGYVLKSREVLEEINGVGYLLEHEKTGARVCLIECDDDNKVFHIGFCTPPKDDTGVPHIIEHSTLCGSQKYPAKDPFVELAKGSMNTFLNAMTYPDKTVYPLASCNDADFKNLMSVYMDAVFYPNIYRNPMIFEQEGWHYELDSVDGELRYNGVVYNEMKGAFSQPEGVLDRYTRHAMFPDTTYACESGGDPAAIPSLTYEQFLEFHSKYYHPSNCFIYLYGDMDMEERLTWIDEAYLSKFEKQDFDASSLIQKQEPLAKMADEEIYYGITEDEDDEEGAYLSWNKVTGSALDTYEVYAFQVLEYVLLTSPGAVLRKALVQKGIGEDIYGGIEPGIRQSYFSVVAKGARREQKEEFIRTVEETLASLVENGINKKSLMAAIISNEFRSREGDYGRYPKGLIIGLNILDTWLYDDSAAFFRIKFNPVYDFLKKAAESDYFEKLIEKRLLNHTHGAVVCAYPRKGLTKQMEEETAKKLQSYKETLSMEELEYIVAHTAKLKAYQEEPSSKEDLEKIPMIHVSDLRREAVDYPWTERMLGESETTDVPPVKLVHYNVFTSDIAYVNLSFDADTVGLEDYGYLGVLDAVFGMLSTEHYSYEELPDEVNLSTGGMSCRITSYQKVGDLKAKVLLRFEISVKALYSKLPEALRLTDEIITSSDYSMTERIREMLLRSKSKMEQKFNSSGHSVAVSRAGSYFSEESYLTEQISGIGYYDFLCELLEHFEERKDELVAGIRRVAGQIFRKEGLIIGVTADEAGLGLCEKELTGLVGNLSGVHYDKAERKVVLSKANEGFTSSSQVNYDAQCGNFIEAGYEYNGAMRVLTMILDYDYLWTRLRVQGGAYGCMAGFNQMGDMYLVSYRDPEVGKTYEVYRKLPEYLRQYDADDMEMEKNIIGAVADLDLPKSPYAQGSVAFASYMSGYTAQMRQKERDEVLNATAQDIRALEAPVLAVLNQGIVCTVGNQGKITENGTLFGQVKPLFH